MASEAGMNSEKNHRDVVAATTETPSSDDIEFERRNTRTTSYFAVAGCVSLFYFLFLSFFLVIPT